MASTSNILVLAALMAVVLPTITMATDFIVGDDKGWTVGVNYKDWAAGKEFVLGDRLVFNYKQGVHNVFKIANATDFQQCVKPTTNDALTSGHDIITLAKPGKKWYFCGFGDHCTNGQKLVILVRETASPAPTPTGSAPHHRGAASYMFGAAVAVGAAMILL